MELEDFVNIFMPIIYQSAISFADVIVDGNAPVAKEGFLASLLKLKNISSYLWINRSLKIG